LALALVAALALLLLADARSAAAAGVDGVADQNLGLWNGDITTASGSSDPFPSYFAQAWVGPPAPVHIAYARFVTAPDTVAQGGTCEQNLLRWYAYATQTLHVTPVISVWQVAEGGCANGGVPSSAKYTSDIQQLLATLASTGTPLRYLEAWNEPNSSGVSASAAAGFWRDAASVCASDGCTALAGGLVDNDPDQGGQRFNPGCAGLTWNRVFKPYEAAYVRALNGQTPAIWAFHPYYAVNCEQPGSVTAFASGLPTAAPSQIWFTEVGAWECRLGQQATPRGPARQQADAAYLNTLLAPPFPVAVAHTFWYELAAPGWTQNCGKYADSALYEANQPLGPLFARPAAATVFGPDTTLAASTGGASGIGAAGATLSGSVTPGGIYEASEYFQYGRDAPSYSSQTATVALAPGLTPQAVNATVSGLSPGTLYHYRVVAVDTAGKNAPGGDRTFVTSRSQFATRR
jgi:hypothetical protein